MISKRRDCRPMKCTTVLHAGACQRTLTPHTSGNNMKENKKNIICHHALKTCGTSNESRVFSLSLKLKFNQYSSTHTDYIIPHCTTLQYNHNIWHGT